MIGRIGRVRRLGLKRADYPPKVYLWITIDCFEAMTGLSSFKFLYNPRVNV